MSCRYDREREEYLVDGEPCRRDDYGDPTRHCGSRCCSQHVYGQEIICARCVGRTRRHLRRAVELSPLAMFQAIGTGVNTEAANLAGPGVDPRDWSARRIAMMAHLLTWEHLGRITERQYGHARLVMEDDDTRHPYVVLTRWQMMIAEDYAHPLPDKLTIANAGAYLERQLGRIACDPHQDFALFADEVRKVARHLEAVIRNSIDPERGAPCPDCRDEGHIERMTREYAHWCEDPDCENMHFLDETGDRWVCPRDRNHWMTQAGYASWLQDRHDATA
jgi:hypothetical protein